MLAHLTFYYLKFSPFVHYEFFFFFLEALRPVLSVSSSVFFLIWLTPRLLFASFVNHLMCFTCMCPPHPCCLLYVSICPPPSWCQVVLLSKTHTSNLPHAASSSSVSDSACIRFCFFLLLPTKCSVNSLAFIYQPLSLHFSEVPGLQIFQDWNTVNHFEKLSFECFRRVRILPDLSKPFEEENAVAMRFG